MPVKKSAEKALRQSKKRMARNLKAKRGIKELTKRTLKAVETKNVEDMKKYSASAIKAIDKAIQKKVLKKNTGARRKSALMRKANSVK